MYEVSNEYLDAVAGRTRLFPTRCKFDGLADYITNKNIKAGTYNDIIDGNNVISMGNACANKIEMTIVNFDQPYVWKGSRFTIEKGLKVEGVTEWVPWGTFWVTNMSTPNNGKTISLVAYDRMYKLSKMKYTTGLTAPFHYCDLLNEFLTNTGMTLNTTADIPSANDADYTILSWPDGEFTYSDIAGHLAGMVGCNARISPEDASVMEFVWYTATGTKIKETLYQDGFERLADSELKIDYLVTGSNREIVIENTDDSTDGELDFKPFDSEDPNDYPWLTFTYNEATLTASVRLSDGYENDTAGIGIPYSLYTNGNIYTVTEVEAYGFDGCNASAIILPGMLTTIGTRAFQNCTGLTELTIPESVTSIDAFVTAGCSNLTTLYYNAINATNASSSDALFSGTGTKTAIIGEGVTTIPAGLLRNASALTYVYIPNTVTTINSHAFRGCTSLESCTIPESVTKIGDSLFTGCTKFTTLYYNAVNAKYSSTSSIVGADSFKTLEIGLGVQSIPQYLCKGCGNLTTVTVAGGVQIINTGAFYGCKGLTSIVLPSSVTTIASTAFKNCSNLRSITIHKTTDSISGSPWGAENADISWVG